jgi:hypothetical protein
MIVPGTLAALYAVDPGEDAFYKAPDGFSSFDAPTPGPTSWTVKTLAAGGSTQIQLDPALGLDALPTLLDPTTNLLYRVTKAEGGLVTVDPPVGTADPASGAPASSPQDLPAGRTLTLQATFDPFGAAHRNLQKHELYIGSESLLNLPTAATIRITELPAGSTITWSYWGKSGSGSSAGWQQLDPDPTQPVLTLNKQDGSIEILNIDSKPSRWLRGTVPPKANAATQVTNIELIVNPKGCGQTAPCTPGATIQSTVVVEGISTPPRWCWIRRFILWVASRASLIRSIWDVRKLFQSPTLLFRFAWKLRTELPTPLLQRRPRLRTPLSCSLVLATTISFIVCSRRGIPTLPSSD